MTTHTLTCEMKARCGRDIDPWPLARNRCSPSDWIYCIRNDAAIMERIGAAIIAEVKP